MKTSKPKSISRAGRSQPANLKRALNGEARPARVSGSLNGYGGHALYRGPISTGNDGHYRPRASTPADISKQITASDRKEIIAYSRQLFAQLGTIQQATLQKSSYVMGDSWLPHFGGVDRKWGDEATAFLTERFYPVADVRGEPFDFRTNLFLDSVSLDIDGDALMILTETETGFPQLKWLAAHRVGSRGYGEEIVKGGEFSGAKLCDGLISSRIGRVIGFRILGETEKEDVDLSAFNAQLLFDPMWQSYGRGLPRLASGILDWFDIQDVDTFLKRQIKRAASIGLMIHNEDGGADVESDFIEDAVAGSTTGVKFENVEGGENFYLKANRGEKMEQLPVDNPQENTAKFMERLERRGLSSLGWFWDLLNPTANGGAGIRQIQDLARAEVRRRQGIIRKRAKRAVIYAVAKAMKSKLISRNDGDWWNWSFGVPPMLTVDQGYEEQADRENLKLGTTTLAAVAQKKGTTGTEVREQLEREALDAIQRAQNIVKATGVTFEIALNLITQRSPNVPQQNAAQNPTP